MSRLIRSSSLSIMSKEDQLMSECLGLIRTVVDKNQTARISVKTSAGFCFVFDNQEVEKTSSSGKKKRKSQLGNVEYLLKREDKSIGQNCC